MTEKGVLHAEGALPMEAIRSHTFCPGVPVSGKNGLFPWYETTQLAAVGGSTVLVSTL
jgi:hypothetical protein